MQVESLRSGILNLLGKKIGVSNNPLKIESEADTFSGPQIDAISLDKLGTGTIRLKHRDTQFREHIEYLKTNLYLAEILKKWGLTPDTHGALTIHEETLERRPLGDTTWHDAKHTVYMTFSDEQGLKTVAGPSQGEVGKKPGKKYSDISLTPETPEVQRFLEGASCILDCSIQPYRIIAEGKARNFLQAYEEYQRTKDATNISRFLAPEAQYFNGSFDLYVEMAKDIISGKRSNVEILYDGVYPRQIRNLAVFNAQIVDILAGRPIPSQ